MQPRALPTPEIVDVKRLDPLVGAMLRELAVQDTLDALISPHKRKMVTVGECVEALVLTILTGEHALSRVAETLAGYDLEVIFQRPMNAAHFHDNRLGRALDALWTTGLDRIYGAVISQAIQRYVLELRRLHTDATSLKVYGAYERDEETEGPLVTFGYSRGHRPDLKHLLFGLTVTAVGIPVWGHLTDGNRRDSTEHRFQITQLRQQLPALAEPLLVADSKFLAGETSRVLPTGQGQSSPLDSRPASGAGQAATLCVRELSLQHHHLTYTVDAEWVPAKRAIRGRPPKEAPRPQCQVWRVHWQVHEATEVMLAQAQRERRFVLATNVLDTQDLADADLLRAYKGQPAAELSFKWAKTQPPSRPSSWRPRPALLPWAVCT
jgi:hypothetical protein